MQTTTVVSMVLPRRKLDISTARFLMAGSLFLALYLGAAELGVFLHIGSYGNLPLFWPPAGIALAGVVLYGYGIWPAFALGSLVFCFFSGMPFSSALGITLASTIQPIFGAYLLRRLPFDPLLARVSDTIALFAIAVVAGTIVPLVYTGILYSSNLLTLSDVSYFFGIQWLGHILSISILTPFIIRWMRRPHPRTSLELLEATAVTGVLITFDILVFLTHYSNYHGIPLIYIILLPLLWISLRVGPRGMTLALLITAGIALASVSLLGSIAPSLAAISLVNTEIFLIVIAVLFLIFVSSEEGRKDALISVNNYVERLEEALQKIRMEDNTKTEFIAILAHELRNPLAAIRTSIEVIGMEFSTNGGVRTLLSAIEERVQTTVRLLDDLLDISRISQRKLELRREIVPVEKILKESLQTIQPLAEGRGHKVETAMDTNCFVLGDPVRLEQICVNLLTNAIKYTPPGGTITVACRHEGDKVLLSIADTGMGISSHMIERIFEPFVQVSQSDYSNSGLGIGLSLTKQLVEMHGGTVEAQSPGKNSGSTFFVRLPATTKGNNSVMSKISDGELFIKSEPMDQPILKVPYSTAIHTKGTRILVVDDNQLAAQGLCRLLNMRGFAATPVYTGEAALIRVKEDPPDAIILDIGLPGMDGYEVVHSLRSDLGFTGGIIALTGYGQERDRQKATEAGFDRHLVKPVGLSDIEAVLKEILN